MNEYIVAAYVSDLTQLLLYNVILAHESPGKALGGSSFLV
jgi:hypothetical protein